MQDINKKEPLKQIDINRMAIAVSDEAMLEIYQRQNGKDADTAHLLKAEMFNSCTGKISKEDHQKNCSRNYRSG